MEPSKNLKAWQLFVALSKGGGIKNASIECDIDASVASRLIDNLERELGFKVLDSTQRPALLNENALFLLPAARQLIRDWEKLKGLISSYETKELSIRFSMPVNSPRRSLYDNMHLYEKKDPFLRIQTFSDLDHEALLEGRADIVYLPYKPDSPELICWEVGTQATALFASREYLKKYGEPSCPAELINHQILLRGGPNYPVTDFLYKGCKKEALVYKKIVLSGDVLSTREALIDGRGISIDLSVSSCLFELKTGVIRPILLGWHRPPWKMTIAIHRRDIANTRLTRFARWIAAEERKALSERKREHGSLVGLDPNTF